MSGSSIRNLALTAALAGFVTAGSFGPTLAQTINPDATINIGSLYEPQNLDNTAGAGRASTRPSTATSTRRSSA